MAAINALARGEHRSAYDTFRRWVTSSKVPSVVAQVRHNLGWTAMRMGALQESIDLLLVNDSDQEGMLRRIGLYPTSATDLALDYGLLGDLVNAEKWLTQANSRRVDMTLPSFEAMLIFARAVYDCRRGAAGDAVRLLAEHWTLCEGTLTGDCLRPLRIVHAFAIATNDRSAKPRSRSA